jgi:predicted MFS family arabinose efflux permease
MAADWALLVVALLVAYDAGGAVLVGFVSLVRMIPATIINVLVDPGRFARPERGLVVVDAVRAGASLVAAIAIVAGQAWLVFAMVAVAAAAGALVRPTTMALLPAVARSPEELVSANVTNSLGEAAGTFVGPLVAGLVIAVAGPAPAAGLAAVACVVAAVVTSRCIVADAARPRRRSGRVSIPLVEGVRELSGRPPAAVIMSAFGAQVTVRGALTTFLAVLALEVLGLGEGGVGMLGAAMGLGGLAGAIGALALGSGTRLVPVALVSLALWGIPIAIIGVAAVPIVAVTALAVVGVANAILDVTGFTLLQRGIPSHARTAVFSVLEVLVGIGISVGGLLGSVLIEGIGTEMALVVTGLTLPLVAIAAWPVARRLDDDAVVPEHTAALLRSIPLFAPLPLGGLELLASGMRPASFAPGDALMVEGEPGDTYLVIEHGHVTVSSGGTLIREQGPNSGVGEIALLRTVPRTATVIATEPVAAWVIDCPTFLAAVTGHEQSAAAAEALVSERLEAPAGELEAPAADLEPDPGDAIRR